MADQKTEPIELAEGAELEGVLNVPEIEIVFRGNVENVNITVNHFGMEDNE